MGCRGPVPQAPQRLGRAEPSQARPPAGPWTGLPPPRLPILSEAAAPPAPDKGPAPLRRGEEEAGDRTTSLPSFLPAARFEPSRAGPRRPSPPRGPGLSRQSPGRSCASGGAGVGAGPGRPGESGDGGGGGGRRKRSRGRLTATPFRRLRGDPALQARLPPRSPPPPRRRLREPPGDLPLPPPPPAVTPAPRPPRVKGRPARLEGETLGGRSGFPGEGSSLRTIVSRGSGRRRGRGGDG